MVSLCKNNNVKLPSRISYSIESPEPLIMKLSPLDPFISNLPLGGQTDLHSNSGSFSKQPPWGLKVSSLPPSTENFNPSDINWIKKQKPTCTIVEEEQEESKDIDTYLEPDNSIKE